MADIVERTGIPKVTVHRMANKSAEDRWLEGDATKFVLVLCTFELGHRVPPQRQLREVATPSISHLRAATGPTANLAVLDGRDVTSSSFSEAGTCARRRWEVASPRTPVMAIDVVHSMASPWAAPQERTSGLDLAASSAP